MSYIIEIATSDFVTTKSAVEGGADRIELCANLAEGGTTASFATIKNAGKHFRFNYTPSSGQGVVIFFIQKMNMRLCWRI